MFSMENRFKNFKFVYQQYYTVIADDNGVFILQLMPFVVNFIVSMLNVSTLTAYSLLGANFEAIFSVRLDNFSGNQIHIKTLV